MIYVLIIIAVIIGALMPLQAGINAELTRFLKHPYLAALISFTIGTITLSIMILSQGLPIEELKRIPSASPHLFLGGLMGALFVGSSIFLIPKMGATTMIGAYITGQLIISIFIDHYGWLGIPATEISPAKVVGVLLMFAGLYLVMGKTT